MAFYGIKAKPSKASQPSLIHEINLLFVTSVNNEFLIEYTPLCFKQYNVDLATEPVKLGVSLFKRTLEFRLEGGGGGTYKEKANGDVPLDEVAFLRLDWL